MRCRRRDVELAAVGLQDQIIGRAANREIREQDLPFQIDNRNLVGRAGGDERFGVIRQDHNLFWVGRRRDGGEGASVVASSSETVRVVAIGDHDNFPVGRDARDPGPLASAAARDDPARGEFDRHTVFEPEAATYARRPSGEKSSAYGAAPTGMRATTRFDGTSSTQA